MGECAPLQCCNAPQFGHRTLQNSESFRPVSQHHVDIPLALNEIVRVSKSNALILVNEVYSHSVTNHVRYSRLVEKYLYPALKQFVYGGQDVYITEDERKLTEKDILQIKDRLQPLDLEKYFNFLVNRVLPDRFNYLNKIDRFLLICLMQLARFLAGRQARFSRLGAGNCRPRPIRDNGTASPGCPGRRGQSRCAMWLSAAALWRYEQSERVPAIRGYGVDSQSVVKSEDQI